MALSSLAIAQSIPVGTPIMEDYYRRQQLLGNLDSTISFVSRPLFQGFESNNISKGQNPSTPLRDRSTPVPEPVEGPAGRRPPIFSSSQFSFSLLPFTWKQQYNTDHPYSLNDGALIPARGYQTMINGGIFAKLGPLSIQLKPELVWAENKPFETFVSGQKTAGQLAAFNNFNSVIDLPESFPGQPYKKAFWGQSSIRLTFGPISAGISTENLWWGPGIRNAMLMTNSAAGFNHWTLNSVRPIRSFIGSFEGQIVGGKLESSGTASSENKRADWRYFNGIVFSYQPRWVPGLFLGATRSFLIYHEDIGSGFSSYLPIFEGVSKKSLYGEGESPKPDDQRISAFIRWLLPKDHFEMYLEYGREDHNYNMRDFLLEPDHTRAYLLGLRKLFELNRADKSYISFNFEMTQMEQNMTNKNRASSYFYGHGELRQGYTNQGQMLGAGIGPGSNLQTATVSWGKGFKSLGFQVERYVHNNNLFYNAFSDIRTHWVDINIAALGEWDYKHFLLSTKLELIRSLNYEYNYEQIPVESTQFWTPGRDTYNFQANLSISYLF